jgi:hypothetical protein
MPEPLTMRCCCGHARRSHVPRWTWHLQAGHGLERHADAPGLCWYCPCPGYFAPLAVATTRQDDRDGRQAL